MSGVKASKKPNKRPPLPLFKAGEGWGEGLANAGVDPLTPTLSPSTVHLPGTVNITRAVRSTDRQGASGKKRMERKHG